MLHPQVTCEFFVPFCRLGLSPEEEPKATLPTLAPDPLPAFLSVHRVSSANNPFISKVGHAVQEPGSANTPSPPASLTSPAFAAELWNDKNPFTSEWDRASRALDPDSIAHFPSSHHPAASVPKTLPGQVSARSNNPFAAGWGQGPESSDTEASRGLSGPPTPSVPSDCHFNDNNPFVSKRGGQAVPGSQAVAGSSPSCLPGGEDCSSAGRPARGAPGGSVDVTAVPDPPHASSDPLCGPPGLAPEPHWGDSAQLQPEESLESSEPGHGECVSLVLGGWQGVTPGDAGLAGQEGGGQHLDSSGRFQMGPGAAGEGAGFGRELGAGGAPSTELSGDCTHPSWNRGAAAAEVAGVNAEPCTGGDKGFVSLSKPRDSPVPGAEQAPWPQRELREQQEPCAGKPWVGRVPVSEPQGAPLAENEPLPRVQPTPRACTVSPGDGGTGRAGSEVLVPPKPAPRVAVLPRESPAIVRAELRAAAPASGEGVKSSPGLPFLGDEASAARGCLPQSPPVTPRGDSSDRPLGKEGDGDLSARLTNLKCVPGDWGSIPATLPVIPEGGSDDELLGDCQESCGVTAGDKGVVGTGEQPRGVTPLRGEQRELSDGSAAAPVIPAALGGGGGGGGAVPGVCKPGSLAVLPPAVGVDSGLGVTSHSRECDGHFESQELERSAGVEERAECDFSEPSAFSSSLSSPCQPHSSSHSLLSDTPSRRAESPKKPTAEGFADKAGNSGKKKLLQARVSPSETFPNQTPRGGETVSPKHR